MRIEAISSSSIIPVYCIKKEWVCVRETERELQWTKEVIEGTKETGISFVPERGSQIPCAQVQCSPSPATALACNGSL